MGGEGSGSRGEGRGVVGGKCEGCGGKVVFFFL